MANTYNGQTVTIVRTAKQGDDGFDAAKDQVVITLANGSQKTVLRTDVANAPPA